MKLYSISGLGADQRTFSFLNLEVEIIPLEWIEHNPNEDLKSYARRLSSKIDANTPFGLIGVSFGGVIATEISHLLNPTATILISSAETKKEFRQIYKLAGRSGVLSIMPAALITKTKFIITWLFGAQNKKLLSEILNDTNPKFAKWCLRALLKWKNEKTIKNKTLKLNGTIDKLFPFQKNLNQIKINNGAHFMIVDKADEVSTIINKFLSKL